MKGLIVALALFAAPLHAQGFGPGCATQWSKINDLLRQADVPGAPFTQVPRQRANGCVVSDIVLPPQNRVEMRARSLAWSGSEMARFTDQGLPPTDLVIELDDLRIIPRIDDPVMDYLFQAQSVPSAIDLRMAARWDAEMGRLHLETVEADFPGDNFIRFEAEISGVDLSTQQSLAMSAGSFSVTRTLTEIRTNGLFEGYLLMAAGAPLLTGDDPPEEQVEALKSKALASIDAMPTGQVPAASKAALKRLVGDMPNPAGTITVAMSADPGLGPARFLGLALNRDLDDLSDIWPLLDGVRLDIRYEP